MLQFNPTDVRRKITELKIIIAKLIQASFFFLFLNISFLSLKKRVKRSALNMCKIRDFIVQEQEFSKWDLLSKCGY